MASEVVSTILIFQAIVYILVYPRLVGVDDSKARVYDAAMTAVALIIVWVRFGSAGGDYRFIFFDTNWFVFGFLVYEIFAVVAWMLYFNFKGDPTAFRALYVMTPKS